MKNETFSRITQKHDIEANWIKAGKAEKPFVPFAGETIYYDADENYTFTRTKVGDGVTNINYLPFSGTQADWDQSDATAADYIKNRTHYEIVEQSEQAEAVLNDVTFFEELHPEYGPVGEYVYEVPLELNLSSLIKENTRVVIDGFVDKPLEGNFVYYDNYLCATLPNAYGTYEPPSLIFYKSENELKFIFRDAAGDVQQFNFEKISFYNDTYTVKQLDEKFIPDTIARKSDIAELQTEVGAKVDKVDGKGLSTNDFTDTEKNKLAGVEAGAEKNVQPDWEQSDSTKDDFIKNKTHGLKLVTTTQTFNSSDYVLDGYESVTVNINSDIRGEFTTYLYHISDDHYDPKSLECTDLYDFEYEPSDYSYEQTADYKIYFSTESPGSYYSGDLLLKPLIIMAKCPTHVWISKQANNPAMTQTSEMSLEIPKAGIWISDAMEVECSYLKQVYSTLDEKYIPDTIAKVVDIKNGTYFTEAEKYDILVDTTTINVEAEDFYYRTTQSPFTAQIIDGNKYLVIFDEVSYICYGRKYNKMNDTLSNSFDYCLIGDVVFNNGNYSRPISGSNLPFCIVNDYFENTNDFTADVLVFGDTASTHTIKIVDVTPTVKKLPEEFLADNFKAVTKGFGEKSAIFGLGQEASGAMSIAAGQSTVASGWMSIALGLASKASGAAALTLGELAEASGTLAVAHGFNTKASGAAAVAAGYGTIAGSKCQLVHGKFNIEDTADTYAHIVGGGENNMNRKNIYALDWTGNAWFAGEVSANSIKIGNTIFTETQLLKILNFIETVEIGNN